MFRNRLLRDVEDIPDVQVRGLDAGIGIQEGLQASGKEWVSLHRNFDRDEIGAADLVVNGTSEISMRNQFRAWARYMALGMVREHR